MMRSGHLLLNRRRLTIPAGPAGPVIDTGLRQVNLNFDPDPGLGDGALASRVMVVPLSPIANWLTITHGEPFLDPVTGTVQVAFVNSDQMNEYEINVLFWIPHTIICPLSADTYNAVEIPNPQI